MSVHPHEGLGGRTVLVIGGASGIGRAAFEVKDWGHLQPPHPEKIVPIGAERACEMFLERHEDVKHLAQPATHKQKTRKRRPS